MELGFIFGFLKNAMVSIIVFFGMIFMPGYYNDAKELVDNSSVETFMSNQTTLAYDKEGNLISKLKDGKDSYYLSFETITDDAKNAFIATEDKDFYSHNGVDLNGIARAAVELVKNREISGGGSTITQQLARNIFLTHEKSFERKIKEIFISKKLEKKYSKDELLEYYINSIYFANGAYGIEAASRKYFGISSTDLTLAQTAFLCAIPNNPTLYNPLTNMENTQKRQARILGYMLEDGYITEDDYNSALIEEIILSNEVITKNNYVDTYIVENATKILMELNGFEFLTSFKNDAEKESYLRAYEEAESTALKDLYTKGYRIYTSFDSEKQKVLQETVDSTLSENQEQDANGIYTLQGAAVSVDNETGKVIAMVGGRNQENISFSFNRAFQSFRQPGSTIKPLIVYTPSFEKGYYPSSIVYDDKSDDGPRNYNEVYEGPITIRYAVEDSKNTVAWNLLREITPKEGLNYLKKMNFSKIVEEDYNLAAALGGLTYGTNVLEMASAYSTIARGGLYYTPTCILKITDADDNVIYTDVPKGEEIYSVKSSRIMTNVLQSVMTEGSGKRVKLENMTSAGKTGTTNELKDGWMAGFTPYITTIVWVGYDSPKSLDGVHGSVLPGDIWHAYMTKVHEGLENKGFAEYENLQAEEEAIRENEENKIYVYNLEKEIVKYENCDYSSFFSKLESIGTYYSLQWKISQVIDESTRNKFYERIDNRKAVIGE